MASLLMVLIISACAVYQYLKGTLIKAFVMIITTICASIAAFGYFEVLANVLISRNILVPWAQMLSFLLLFVLAFAILQTIAGQLTRKTIDLGLLAERVGRIICGILVGFIISGLLLTALAMAPLPSKVPYQRFDTTKPNPEKPSRVLLNADGFAIGWFNIISSGSFSGKRSFATLHPDFLDQLFLNRHKITDGISTITGSAAIEIPAKISVWPAPEDLKDSDEKPVLPKSGHNLTIVRVGITTNAMEDGGTFTLSQLRLVCKEKSDIGNPLAGKGVNIYPVGYLKTANQLQIKQLSDKIQIERSDFDGRIRWIDFAFYVPNGFAPVLAGFKQNNIAQVPPSKADEPLPPPAPFIQQSECAKDIAELQPISSAKVYGLELATMSKLLSDLTLQISDPNQWQNAQTEQSIKPAQFDENGKINYVRAELKMEKPDQEESEAAKKKQQRKSPEISKMLKPLKGYTLLSLKCNNLPTGAALRTRQLPVLVDLFGLIHHPVGVVASTELGNHIIYEIDYCSLTAEDIADGLTIAEDGSVAKPFPDTVWITEKVRNISEFYVLYLVKSDSKAIITSVQPTGSQTAAQFKEYQGFLVR